MGWLLWPIVMQFMSDHQNGNGIVISIFCVSLACLSGCDSHICVFAVHGCDFIDQGQVATTEKAVAGGEPQKAPWRSLQNGRGRGTELP